MSPSNLWRASTTDYARLDSRSSGSLVPVDNPDASFLACQAQAILLLDGNDNFTRAPGPM